NAAEARRRRRGHGRGTVRWCDVPCPGGWVHANQTVGHWATTSHPAGGTGIMRSPTTPTPAPAAPISVPAGLPRDLRVHRVEDPERPIVIHAFTGYSAAPSVALSPSAANVVVAV